MILFKLEVGAPLWYVPGFDEKIEIDGLVYTYAGGGNSGHCFHSDESEDVYYWSEKDDYYMFFIGELGRTNIFPEDPVSIVLISSLKNEVEGVFHSV